MPASPRPSPVPHRAHRRQTGIFYACVGAFALIVLAVWVRDARLLLRAHPVPAIVVESEVREFETQEREDGRVRTRRRYAPEIGYRYVVDGVERAGGAVFAGSYEQRTEGWAESIVDRFPPGDSTVAFVDPTDPERAYLVREPSAVPLLFMAIPVALLGFLPTARAGIGADPLQAPDPSPSGERTWALAARDDSLPGARTGELTSRLWTAAALVVLGLHLLLVGAAAAGAPGTGRAKATLWHGTLGEWPFVLSVGALALVGRHVRRHRRRVRRTARRIAEAHVIVDCPRLVAGSEVKATLQPSLLDQRFALLSPTMRLECATHEVRTDSPRVRETVTPPADGDAARPNALRPLTFALPASAPPSTVREADPVRTIWAFVATLYFADGHEVELRFPVRVHAPG